MKPRILDLFCGAGGAAMGYARAGFDVTGVDHRPQPNYPFGFLEEDALLFLSESNAGWFGPWDAIHASPPCQHYSQASKGKCSSGDHPDLVAATRARLMASGLPWVLENVVGAPMVHGLMLCGSMFGLPVRRHRLFDCSELIMSPAHVGCARRKVINFYGHRNGHSVTEAPEAFGVPWMTSTEALQAIPPCYTQFIGEQLFDSLRGTDSLPNQNAAQ